MTTVALWVTNEAGQQVTTGTPISLVIKNVDQRAKDYSDIKDKFRPGHADYTYWKKYKIRDFRGGGRSSARETAMRVAAGAIARKLLDGITIRGALVQIGNRPVDRSLWDWDAVDSNQLFCPDPATAVHWGEYLDEVRKAGSSIGAVIEVVAEGVPAGLGAPIYAKLDQDLASAMMSINAVKGVEIGAGMGAAELTGEENADEIRSGPDAARVPARRLCWKACRRRLPSVHRESDTAGRHRNPSTFCLSRRL